MSLRLPSTAENLPSQDLGTDRKVKLKPGKGLMGWIRQSNAGRMSRYPIMVSVDDVELSRHDRINDCWILLYDMVYDVTAYLDFHPGGVDEIMRAAGTDATELFNEIHMWKKESEKAQKRATRNSLYYGISMGVVAIGLTFAAIPAYRIFCETTSFGGTTQVAKDFDKIENMEKVKSRLIQVQFNADMPSSMQWNFKPLQNEIYVHPGETALAFFTASNPTDRPIVGISSYNLTPFQAAYYFHKIQCFCFEEQILNPGEEVDLPVFFYIDPDFANDPALQFMDQMLLSYTFFESKPNLTLPSPFDPNNRPVGKQLDSPTSTRNEERKKILDNKGKSTIVLNA